MSETELPESIEPQTRYNKKNKFIAIASIFFLTLAGSAFLLTKQNQTSASPNVVYSPKGEVVIPFQFDSVSGFQEGMSEYSTRPSDAPLFTGGGNSGQPLKFNFTEDLSGFVNKDGKIFPPVYSMALSYSEGLASVQSNNKFYGVVDKEGKWVIQPTYNFIGDFHDGLAEFQKTEGSKFGYLDKTGKAAIPAVYASTNGFSEGRTLACLGKNQTKYEFLDCAYITTKNEPITKFIYSSYSSNGYSEGLAMACTGAEKDMRCGYLDLDGKPVSPMNYGYYEDSYQTYFPTVGSFTNSRALIGGLWYEGIQKWGFFNKKFKPAIQAIFTKELDHFKSNPWDFDINMQWQTVGTTKDNPGRSAAVDKNGNIKFFSTYQDIRPFSQGLSAVKVGTKWGFINEKNEMVVKPIYEDARDYSEGLAPVRLNGKWGFIN